VRIIDVFPTPVSPSNRTLYVTSFPVSVPPVDDDIRDDDVVVDEDDDEFRAILSRHITASQSASSDDPVALVTSTCSN